MRNKSCVHAMLLCSIAPFVVASAQFAVGQTTPADGNLPSSSNREVIADLFQRLEDAHLREIKTVSEAHKRELDAVKLKLRAAQGQIDLQRQENLLLTQQVEQLQYQVDRWKTLASPHYFNLLAKIKERSEELSKRNREGEYEIPDLERRHQQAELALTRTKSRLAAFQEEQTRIRKNCRQLLSPPKPGSKPKPTGVDVAGGADLASSEVADTSKKMEDLKRQSESVAKEVEEGKATSLGRESEFKRLDQRLSSIKETQERRRVQRRLLEEAYDRVLLEICSPRN